jgi:acetyltransferase-like isoleucine patch superfamily enzyme
MSNRIGDDTNIWQFCVIFPKAVIGRNCNICANVLIENEVVIGNNVTVKSGVQIWDGVTIEDNVCIGPNVTFTNDIVPRSKAHRVHYDEIIIRGGASIGANSTIVAGIVIGEYAFIGAGSVVTKNIPPYTVWYGNPARQKGFVTKDGILLDMNKIDKEGKKYEI